jgi:hypothetical protein
MKSSRECTVALAVAMACILGLPAAHADPGPPGAVVLAHSCIVGRDGRPRALNPTALAPRPRTALADTNHLRVTFDSPDNPWTASEITRLQAAVATFLPLLEEVCGPPAGADVINVIKDPSLPYQGFAGTYSPGDHSIRIYQVDTGTLCHELAHAFHGDDVVYWDGFEEGMAVAATALVLGRLGEPKIDHVGGTDDVEYEILNQPSISPHSGSFWAGMPGVILRYDMAGYVWRKTALEHPGFLRDFNRLYYAQLALDDTLRGSITGLIGIAGEVAPTVEGEPFAQWAGHQYVLGTTRQLGVQLYLFPFATGAALFFRHADGYEEPLGFQNVAWSATDAENVGAGSGEVSTDLAGLATIYPDISPYPRGRLTIETDANTPYGSQTSTVERTVTLGRGLFGLVRGASEGTVTIAPLDTALAPETVRVQWGEFEAPRWESLAGRFELTYVDPAGRRVTRRLTKDASSYFALIDAPGGALPPAAAVLTARPSIALAGCRLSMNRALASAAHVTLYAVNGKILRVLTIPAGALAVDWDGMGADGLFASAGVYVARLVAPGVDARTRVVVTH